MAEYKGAGSEGQRQMFLEKQREKMLEDVKKKKEEIRRETQVRIGSDKFISQNDFTESELKRQTIGLVQLEDFQRIRETLELEDRKRLEGDELAKLKKKKRKKTTDRAKLSFDDVFEEQEDGAGRDSGSGTDMNGSANGDANGDDAEAKPKIKKVKKNPFVDTSFLPDREREEKEQRERDELKKLWLQEQEKIKQEKISVTYSYWDGSGHRKMVDCKKGDSIGQFLEKCRQQWHQLRGVSVDNMMYIKEDLIIPHHYTFYDFIVNKTRGKSGPLFSFDVRDDIRLTHDASVETEESHAGKVIERAWYEKNKHIFPASRWEVFDPQKDYGKYTIKDLNKEKEK
ncbi:hypothetical protein HK102_011641 [Quaeritorhiza haematococci]|nr:hypothetical protein HK102_011641 [Quaeritorhiza haematococci]